MDCYIAAKNKNIISIYTKPLFDLFRSRSSYNLAIVFSRAFFFETVSTSI